MNPSPRRRPLVLAACSLLLCAAALRADSTAPAGTIESLPASSPYGEATAIRNVPYVEGATALQTFDLYLPKERGSRPLPFIVWTHGGAWELHSKEWDNVKYLVRQGYAIATVDYRLVPENRFPAQIQDCNAALNFLVDHAADYGLDGQRFAVGGASAGGHLCLLLGLARKEKAFGADPALQPRAILDFFGPTDLNAAGDDARAANMAESIKLHARVLPRLLGATPEEDPAAAGAASRVSYVRADAAPTLVFHGTKDALVPVVQSERLHALLDERKVKNELVIVEGAPHDGPRFSTPEQQEKVVEFLRAAMP